MNGPTPAFKAWLDKRAAEKEAEPKEFPAFKMGKPAPALVEFRPVGPDDGAKARLKELSCSGTYIKWFKPQSVGSGGKGNSLVTCINTEAHNRGDSKASMNINDGTNGFTCEGCDWKGDIITLAAVAAGLIQPGEQCPDELISHAVKFGCEDMFPDMVGKFVETAGNWAFDPNTVPYDPSQFTQYAEPPDPKTALQSGPPDKFNPELNWRDFVPANTALRTYLTITTQDGNPEEFHFFNFMNIIGLMMGREVVMGGDYPLVHANMLYCIIGATGQGKSKSLSFIREILNSPTLRFDYTDHETRGIRIVSGVGSGEVLVDSLGHSVKSPAINPGGQQMVLQNMSPRSLVIWTELSNLVAKTKATGSTVSDKVIDMFDLVDPMAAISRGAKSYAHHAFGSGVTTTQLEVVNKLLTSTELDNGFINRWFFVVGTPKPYEAFNSRINIGPIYPYIEELAKWVDYQARQNRGQLLRTDAATAEATKFLTERVRPRQTDSDLGTLFARSDLLFKKLILICAANMLEREISIEAVYQAEKIWNYLEYCYLVVADKLSEDIGVEIYNFVVHTVKAAAGKTGKDGKPEHITPSALTARVTRKYHTESYVIDRIIQRATRDGAIELYSFPPDKQGGRPRKRYIPND